jgi:hypothetical protein
MEQLLREGLKNMTPMQRLEWKRRVEAFLKEQNK